MFTWLFGDRGIPASYRHMDGFGSHTFQWTNEAGEQSFVKYHFKTDQGIKCLTGDEAAKVAGENPDSHQMDLLQAIDRGDYPTWTLKVQIMPAAQAKTYRFNPFDLTKVWPYEDYPLRVAGKLTLNRNPDNYFADVEQAAFDPAHFVPGIGPSPDKMLQGRLFAYGDAHRYRLGANHIQLPVNSPHAAKVANYGRDGFMRSDGNFGSAKNYEPNSFGGPAETGEPLYAGLATDGPSGTYEWDSHEGDDFVQAGALYRVMDEAARARLVGNIAPSLSQVSKNDIVERSIAHFEKADPEYGARVRAAVAELRK
jgi:catalase